MGGVDGGRWGFSEAVSPALLLVGIKAGRIKLQYGKLEGALAKAPRDTCFRPRLLSASLP